MSEDNPLSYDENGKLAPKSWEMHLHSPKCFGLGLFDSKEEAEDALRTTGLGFYMQTGKVLIEAGEIDIIEALFTAFVAGWNSASGSNMLAFMKAQLDPRFSAMMDDVGKIEKGGHNDT